MASDEGQNKAFTLPRPANEPDMNVKRQDDDTTPSANKKIPALLLIVPETTPQMPVFGTTVIDTTKRVKLPVGRRPVFVSRRGAR